MDLQKKIEFAKSIIELASRDAKLNNSPLELCYSGGKDSDVLLHLAKSVGVDFIPIYKNTTIDPPYTIAHCKANGVSVVNPDKTFLELIEQKGYPTVRARFCCKELKEYKIYDVALLGIRSSESKKREKNYKEPQICRAYSKTSKVRQYLPLLNWTDEDIAEYIKQNKIQCHPLYYDKAGRFHVERRLGCIGCPFSDQRQEFKQYPNMLKAWIKAGKKYLQKHPSCGAAKKFGDAYELMIHNLFYDSYEEYYMARHGLFPVESAKNILEKYFKINL